MKRVIIIVKSAPFNTINPAEAFRTAMGLTIKDNMVTVILIDKGVTNLLSLRSDIIQRPDREQSLGMFNELNIRIIAEREAGNRYNIQTAARKGIELLDKKDIIENIIDSDVVISF
ncbi:MAG: DsrE family protein [Nitrospirota bacterium]